MLNSRADQNSDQPDRLPRGLVIAQPVDIRRQNFSSILRAVMTHGPVARADLATMTGLTTGTVTKLTAILGEAGLLRELAAMPREATPGRPRVPVVIDSDRFRVVGLHIGLLHTSLCLLNLRGELVSELKLTHRRRGSAAVLDEAIGGVRQLLAGDDGVALAVGASTGGWVDADSGVVVEQVVLGWQDVPVRDVLESALGLPVRVDSNFRALALAEHWFGANAGMANLVQLFVGNVVGAGFLLNGRLYHGSTSAAGALDHLPVHGRADQPCRCGRRDCLHVVASDIALVRRAREEGVLTRAEGTEALIAHARSGDERAARMLARRARQVGTAAGILVELLDPQVVVIGGGVVDAPEYLEHVQEGAARYLADKREVDVTSLVRATSFGTHAISVSSAAVALDAFYQDPGQFVPVLRELRYG
ncbi:MAG: ROK family protein [Actinocatenispora sp.]